MTAVADSRPRPRSSMRWSVVAVVVLTIVPALFLTGWLATWLAQSERSQLEQNARNQAREVVAAIDREIISTQNLLVVLAGSPFLQSGSIEEFYHQAAEVSRKVGLRIVLRDHEINRQVVNTGLPWGAPLTDGIPPPQTELDAELVRAGKPFVSNVFFGPLIKQHLVAVVVPVFQRDELRYSVAAAVPLTRFSEIFQTLNFQPNQLVTAIDRRGVIVTRSERHAGFAGTQVQSAFPLDVQNVGRSVNREGISFHWYNRRSEFTGWYFSVGIPDKVLEAPLTRARATFVAAGTLLLAIAIVFSYRWGGQLARSSGALGIDRKPTQDEFEVLFDSAPNGVMVLGDDGIITLVNKRIETKFGYFQDELIGQPVELLLPERYRSDHGEVRSIFVRGTRDRSTNEQRELFGRRKDGGEFPIEITVSPISTLAEKLVIAIVVDISARKLSERKLLSALRERDDLRRRLVQAHEEERLRLARELHDQTGQSLTAAMLELKSIETLAKEPERCRLRMLRKQMDEIGKTLHRVAWELRPASIDEIGLASALSNHISEWSVRCGIESHFYCGDVRPDELSDEIRTTIYRVVQEALTNIAKHATNATEITVVLEGGESGLRLTIDDNGCGFDGNASATSGGLGLAGMRERLSLIGGELEIESALDGGTTIFARIPLKQESVPS